MAVTARFEADFSSFQAAVANAEVKLRSFETGAAKVETALSRMTDSFSGRKLIQDATLMAEAVAKIGGVSKLTDTELSKIAPSIKDAIEKMQKLGLDVPPAFHAIQDASAATFSEFAAGIPIVGQLIAALSVEKMVAFALSSLHGAAALKDLAIASGVSADELQRLSFVGAEFGLSADEMAKGVEQLSTRLAGGDKSAVNAVQSLGLTVKELVSQGPANAFLTIADAVSTIQDPMARNAAAADLFGNKLARQLLPALGDLRTKMKDVPTSAVITDANIDAADRFDDALAHAAISAKALTVNLTTLPIHIFDAYRTFFSDVTEAELQASVGARGFFESQINATSSVEAGLSAADQMKNTLIAWRTEGLEPLTDAQRDAIEEGDRYGKSQEEIAKAVGASTVAVHQYLESAKQATQDLAKAQAEADAILTASYANQIRQLDAATKASLAHYSFGGQIAALAQLDKAEQALSLVVEHSLTAEKDRASVRADAHAQHLDILNQEAGLQEKQADIVTAAINREAMAQVELNRLWGQEADGSIHVQLTALEILQRKLTDLVALDGTWVGVAKQKALLEKEYTDSLYAGAAALDKAYAAQLRSNDEFYRTVEAANKAKAALDGYTFSLRAAAVAESDLLRPQSNLRLDTQAAIQSGPALGTATRLGNLSGVPQSGFGAPIITNNFNIVDTESGIARRVGDRIGQSISGLTTQ